MTLLDVMAIEADPPPFSHAYTLNFDNTGVAAELIVASFLDVNGGGLDDVGGADVFGWFGEGTDPAPVSSASSQLGLDFALPRAEIQGTITFAVGQTEARVDVSGDPTCEMSGFRPGIFAFSSGPYTINGVYPGTYCVSADDNISQQVCFGDATCQNPTPITLTETEVRTGIDLDFSAIVPVEKSSWGRVKARFR